MASVRENMFDSALPAPIHGRAALTAFLVRIAVIAIALSALALV